MKDTRRHALAKMGISTSSIPATITPADVTEDTCPLCGHFYPLDKNGHCGTQECRRAARQTVRKMLAQGVEVPGMYYKFGDLEVMNFAALEVWEEPKQIKHPDMCQVGECTDWALPADHRCKHHKMAEKREEMQDRNAARRKGNKSSRRTKSHTKSKRISGNKIKGLDKIKV